MLYTPEIFKWNTIVDPFKKHSFPDLGIEINDGKFTSEVYDKRRDFNFEILGLPAFTSNIPAKLTYNVLCSQMLRYAKMCSDV